jgi:methionyl-tRNA formyltransferase
MVRAVYFGSSDSVFSNRHFEALLGACEVAAVVDVPPARRVSTNSSRQAGGSFVEIARKKGIPSFEPTSPNAPEFIENVKALSPDLFVAVGYMLLLKAVVLSVPRVVAANFHASLLPAYRGKHPVFWALRNGEPWCGLSIHEMSPGLDTGDIIFQVHVPTKETDSVSRLYERIMTASVPLVPRLIAAVAEGAVPRRPQSSEGASYFGATSDADFRISWSMEAALIQRWVTATPGQCFTDVGGKRVYLLDARAFVCANGEAPGTVLAADEGLCMIAAVGGAVGVQRVRLPDGTETSGQEAFTRLGSGEGAILGGQ